MTAPKPASVSLSLIQLPPGVRKPDPGLTASISQLGVLEPVGLVADGTGYRILYGARRIQAARTLGLSKIPAVVYPADLTPAEEKCLTIVENLQRQNLTALEAGALFLDLLALGHTLGEVAKMVSRPASYVSACVAVASLPQVARDLIAQIPHSVSALALLARLPAPALIHVLETTPQAAANVDAARDAVRAAGRPLAPAHFPLDDCDPCEHKAGNLCLDRECWGKKLAGAVGDKIASLRRDPTFRDAPCVCEKSAFDFASEEDANVFKAYAAAPLIHRRVAVGGESGDAAILLGPGGEVRGVRLVALARSEDGRAVRYGDPGHKVAIAERETAVALADKLRAQLEAGWPSIREGELGELAHALAEATTLHPLDDASAFAVLARLALPQIVAWAQTSAVRRPPEGWRAFNRTLRRLLGEE